MLSNYFSRIQQDASFTGKTLLRNDNHFHSAFPFTTSPIDTFLFCLSACNLNLPCHNNNGIISCVDKEGNEIMTTFTKQM